MQLLTRHSGHNKQRKRTHTHTPRTQLANTTVSALPPLLPPSVDSAWRTVARSRPRPCRSHQIESSVGRRLQLAAVAVDAAQHRVATALERNRVADGFRRAFVFVSADAAASLDGAAAMCESARLSMNSRAQTPHLPPRVVQPAESARLWCAPLDEFARTNAATTTAGKFTVSYPEPAAGVKNCLRVSAAGATRRSTRAARAGGDRLGHRDAGSARQAGREHGAAAARQAGREHGVAVQHAESARLWCAPLDEFERSRL